MRSRKPARMHTTPWLRSMNVTSVFEHQYKRLVRRLSESNDPLQTELFSVHRHSYFALLLDQQFEHARIDGCVIRDAHSPEKHGISYRYRYRRLLLCRALDGRPLLPAGQREL